jgi:hypothetical protein
VSARTDDWIDAGDDVEEVDAVAVTVMPQASELSPRYSLPSVAQAAAVAVTGFAAGAVAAAVVHRSRSRRPALPSRRSLPENGLAIASTRSFLIHVHELAPRS